MRDLIRHLNQFNSQYRAQRRKEIVPQRIFLSKIEMDVKIPITIYDPKNLKRVMPAPVQEACYSVRPMSKKQIFKLDRDGVMADSKAVGKGGFNLKSDDLDKTVHFKPYGKNTPKDRVGKALLRRFRIGDLLPGNMTVGQWNKLRAMGEDLN